MKINEKWTLFLIATFTTFFGITNNFLQVTEAKEIEMSDEVVLLDDADKPGLIDVILNDNDFKFDSNIFSYNVIVDELDKLKFFPILANDEIDYKVNVIGNKKIDKSLIIIVTINSSTNGVYTFYIEEKQEEINSEEME